VNTHNNYLPRFSSTFFLHRLNAVSRILSSFDFCSFAGPSSLVKIVALMIDPLVVTHLNIQMDRKVVNLIIAILYCLSKRESITLLNITAARAHDHTKKLIKATTHFTAGCFEFRNARAFLHACVTIATCCGSLRLPDLMFLCMASFSHNAGAMTDDEEDDVDVDDDDVNDLEFPRPNPSSSAITAQLKRIKRDIVWITEVIGIILNCEIILLPPISRNY
jgi:hypothetical protein